LVISHWSLVIGHWSLDISQKACEEQASCLFHNNYGRCLLVIGKKELRIDNWDWLLVICYRLLVDHHQ